MQIWWPYLKRFLRYEFLSRTFGLVTDRQTDRQTESEAYEPTVHKHRWAQIYHWRLLKQMWQNGSGRQRQSCSLAHLGVLNTTLPNRLRDFRSVSRRCPADWWFTGDPTPLARDNILNLQRTLQGVWTEILVYPLPTWLVWWRALQYQHPRRDPSWLNQDCFKNKTPKHLTFAL